MATNSPFATDMLKSRKASVALPSGEMKRHDTFRNSIAGVPLETRLIHQKSLQKSGRTANATGRTSQCFT